MSCQIQKLIWLVLRYSLFFIGVPIFVIIDGEWLVGDPYPVTRTTEYLNTVHEMCRYEDVPKLSQIKCLLLYSESIQVHWTSWSMFIFYWLGPKHVRLMFTKKYLTLLHSRLLTSMRTWILFYQEKDPYEMRNYFAL